MGGRAKARDVGHVPRVHVGPALSRGFFRSGGAVAAVAEYNGGGRGGGGDNGFDGVVGGVEGGVVAGGVVGVVDVGVAKAVVVNLVACFET